MAPNPPELALMPVPVKPAPKPVVIRKITSNGDNTGTWGGQCVVFARNYLKIANPAFGGYAGRIKPNSQTPEVGEVVLTYTHAAVIIGLTADGDMILIESNYGYNELITVGRKLNVNDPIIRGYFKP